MEVFGIIINFNLRAISGEIMDNCDPVSMNAFIVKREIETLIWINRG